MKAKKNLIVTIVLLAIFLAVVQVTQVAGKSEQKANATPRTKWINEQRDILAGLQGVSVLVEPFRPKAQKYGFNKEKFKTDVELRLRQYGIKVVPTLSSKHPAVLYVYINPLIDETTRNVAIRIDIKLFEAVTLLRNKSVVTSAATWSADSIGLDSLPVVNGVREKVKDLVDAFINDYLAANPKEQTPQQKTKK